MVARYASDNKPRKAISWDKCNKYSFQRIYRTDGKPAMIFCGLNNNGFFQDKDGNVFVARFDPTLPNNYEWFAFTFEEFAELLGETEFALARHSCIRPSKKKIGITAYKDIDPLTPRTDFNGFLERLGIEKEKDYVH